MKLKLVVIGNGIAGLRMVEEMIQIAPDKYAITLFGAEPHGNYNRIMRVMGATGDVCHDAQKHSVVRYLVYTCPSKV
jgi:hypothetical protein